MDKLPVYPGSIPLDTDDLQPQRNLEIALGFLMQAAFGTGTIIDGLAVTQTTVPSLAVKVGPGSILTSTTVDTLTTGFGSLAVDNANPLVKMGVNLTPTTMGVLAAPATTGYSVNVLVEAQFIEADGNAVVLPFYNAANPAIPYTGPAGTGTPNNTARTQRVQLQYKYGTAAASGSQVTPSPDAGWVGVAVVTVPNGASAITNGSISAYSNAPLVDAQKLGRGVQPGRLIGTRTFTSSGTYVPTLGTNSIEVEVLGGGGGGGGGAATGASQVSAGCGGGAGGYARRRVTSGFSSVFVTIGAGGTIAAGGAGGTGGTTSFGSLVSATGGSGGSLGPAGVASGIPVGFGGGGNGVGGDVNVVGGAGAYAVYTQPATSGQGGTSAIGAGGVYLTGSSDGNASPTVGAGGSGGVQSVGGGGAATGGAGAPGLCIVKEYT